MKYLGLDEQLLIEKGALHTALEICQQPQLWEKIYESVLSQQPQLNHFLGEALSKCERIILIGAGTSAFIGLSLRGIFQRSTGLITEAISTTDLVSHPHDYLFEDISTLVVSFARSGNSPESEAAVALADRLCKTCYHLIVICNAEGNLAKYPAKNKFVFGLPQEANDKSLAMTSSYSGMLLAGLLIAQLDQIAGLKNTIQTLVKYGERAISYYAEELKVIAEKDFSRAVFLGSGPLFGTATESHLKLQELTDGKIICKSDSFLGFRHGPKAVINESTLVVYIFSNDEYTLKYEKDLVESMKKGHRPLLEIGIMESKLPGISLDHKLHFAENGSAIREEFLTVYSVIPAQILGFFKSLQVGLRPDSPSFSGAITRVVEGVQIYDLKKK